MIKLEKTEVFGWESAIRGMRNPMNSWDKSDSYYDWWEDPSPINPNDGIRFFVGENDLKLMKKLSNAGNDHGKFLRMINVTVDITAPLYWWKEFDTYKVGTVANSCSTMHKIHAKEFTLDDFSHEHLYLDSKEMLETIIKGLNAYREDFLREKDNDYWWQMIQMLPSSYNQKRTVQLNYQVLKSMYFARKNHKLDEWREFCEWVEGLPYFKEIVLDE
jgi:hypothetical protein